LEDFGNGGTSRRALLLLFANSWGEEKREREGECEREREGEGEGGREKVRKWRKKLLAIIKSAVSLAV